MSEHTIPAPLVCGQFCPGYCTTPIGVCLRFQPTGLSLVVCWLVVDEVGAVLNPELPRFNAPMMRCTSVGLPDG